MSEVIQPGLAPVHAWVAQPVVHGLMLCPEDNEAGKLCDWEAHLQVTRKPCNDASQTLLILHSVLRGWP